MAAKTKKSSARKGNSRLTRELLETARDMRASGVMTGKAYEKITMRHMSQATSCDRAPLTGKDIKALREKARLSQAVFARYLNLTTGYVSQLERGAKRPTGPALVMLDIVRRKGIAAIL